MILYSLPFRPPFSFSFVPLTLVYGFPQMAWKMILSYTYINIVVREIFIYKSIGCSFKMGSLHSRIIMHFNLLLYTGFVRIHYLYI